MNELVGRQGLQNDVGDWQWGPISLQLELVAPRLAGARIPVNQEQWGNGTVGASV